MAWESTVVATVLGWAGLVIYAATAATLVYARSRSRASIIVDTLIRTAVPLAVTQGVLVYADTSDLAHAEGWWWVAAEGILAVVAVYMLLTAGYLAAFARKTDGFVIVSRGLLEGVHRRLDDMYGPGPARIITYSVGKQVGEADMRNALDTGLASRKGIWRLLPYVFRMAGLGRVRYGRFEPGREVEALLKGSFEVFTDHEHGDASNGCDITRGYLAGIGKAVFPDKECQAEETRCVQVHGGDTCTFVIRWFDPVKPQEKREVLAGDAA